MYNENKHIRFMRKQRRKALFAVLNYNNSEIFRNDYGFFKWLTTFVKASICLIFGKETNYYLDKECFASYDNRFNVDHYNWSSVYVNTDWRKKWEVAIVFNCE